MLYRDIAPALLSLGLCTSAMAQCRSGMFELANMRVFVSMDLAHNLSGTGYTLQFDYPGVIARSLVNSVRTLSVSSDSPCAPFSYSGANPGDYNGLANWTPPVPCSGLNYCQIPDPSSAGFGYASINGCSNPGPYFAQLNYRKEGSRGALILGSFCGGAGCGEDVSSADGWLATRWTYRPQPQDGQPFLPSLQFRLGAFFDYFCSTANCPTGSFFGCEPTAPVISDNPFFSLRVTGYPLNGGPPAEILFLEGSAQLGLCVITNRTGVLVLPTITEQIVVPDNPTCSISLSCNPTITTDSSQRTLQYELNTYDMPIDVSAMRKIIVEYLVNRESLCPADFDNGFATGCIDGAVGIEDLLYYLPLFESGSPQADLDDGEGTGSPDGGVGIDDLLYYLDRFGAGC